MIWHSDRSLLSHQSTLWVSATLKSFTLLCFFFCFCFSFLSSFFPSQGSFGRYWSYPVINTWPVCHSCIQFFKHVFDVVKLERRGQQVLGEESPAKRTRRRFELCFGVERIWPPASSSVVYQLRPFQIQAPHSPVSSPIKWASQGLVRELQ